MCRAARDVAYGPKADIIELFDHLVGERKRTLFWRRDLSLTSIASSAPNITACENRCDEDHVFLYEARFVFCA